MKRWFWLLPALLLAACSAGRISSLGLAGPVTVRSLLFGSPDIPLGAGEGSFALSLPAGEVELLRPSP